MPPVLPVGGLDEHTYHCPGVLSLVDDADFVVHELHFVKGGIGLQQRFSQGVVEGVHRPIAFGCRVHQPVLYPDLDHRLRQHVFLLAIAGRPPSVLHNYHEVHQLKGRGVAFQGPSDHQRKGGLGAFVLEPPALLVLDLLQQSRNLVPVDPAVQAHLPEAILNVATAGKLRDGNAVDRADFRWLDVLVALLQLGDGVGVEPPLVAEGAGSHVWLVAAVGYVDNLTDVVRHVPERRQLRVRHTGDVHFQLEVCDNR